MNKAILIGRATGDPEVRVSQDGNTRIAKYTLAIDRIGQDKGADFIRCSAFNKAADFAEKYIRKGMKIAIEGRIQTGQYKDKDGKTVYTTDVIVSNHEFCERRSDEPAPVKANTDDFMDIPDSVQEELPFL